MKFVSYGVFEYGVFPWYNNVLVTSVVVRYAFHASVRSPLSRSGSCSYRGKYFGQELLSPPSPSLYDYVPISPQSYKIWSHLVRSTEKLRVLVLSELIEKLSRAVKKTGIMLGFPFFMFSMIFSLFFGRLISSPTPWGA